MRNLQAKLQKTLQRGGVHLTTQDILLGIYGQLADLSHQAAKKEKLDQASLGELATLVLQLCADQGLDLEKLIADYLADIS